MSGNNQENQHDFVLGIDLGTSNSCVSIWRNNNLEVIPDQYGNRTMPSVVAFTNKTRYVGLDAKNQIEINPENTFYEVKRLIGRKFSDDSVQGDLQFISYHLEKDNDDNILLCPTVSNKKYTPEEISAMILRELKINAESYLNRPVSKVVISVPAYFNDSQRQATSDAAKIAGLECLRIISEPTAAALAYGLEKVSNHKNTDINVIVYDLGGGTTDVSLLNISNGLFQVLASSGNTHLGGADFDNRLVNFCLNEFKRKYNIDPNEISSISLQALKKKCENAKKMLSITWKTIIAVKEFHQDKNLYIEITKKKFEEICRDLFILCLKPIEDVLTSCDMPRSDIHEIILVGGCTRIPLIRQNIKSFFSKDPNGTINPDEVVSAGAAIQGHILSQDDDPFSENVVLLDIIPLSLGVETIGGVMTNIIHRNSVIPIKKKKKFTTDSDNETCVKIKIFEGERQMTRDNFLVGEFELHGLEKAMRGIAEIEITFVVDVNGIISVTAEDLKNNENKNTITITGNKGRLSPDKIKQLVEEAVEMEILDRRDRSKRQAYYEIDDLCNNIKTNINSETYKLKNEDKELIENDINNILNWLSEKTYLDRTEKEFCKILEKIKKKYGNIMMKLTNINDESIKAGNNTNVGTTVYGNEEDEETFFEKVELEEFENNAEERKQLKQLRENLMDLCYSIFDIIEDKNLVHLDEENTTKIRIEVNEVLLWVHVKEKITKDEYLSKIDELNNLCNSIVDKNENIFNELNDEVLNSVKKNELEQLLYTILGSIENNLFSIGEESTNELKIRSEKYLEELKNTNSTTEIYQFKINDINNLCNNLYEAMVNSKLKENICVNESSNDESDDECLIGDDLGGTSLDKLS